MNASASVHIERSPSDGFAHVMEVSNDANRRTGVVEAAFTTEQPVEIGSEVFDRVDANGRTAEARWRVSDWEPDSHGRWDLVSGPIAGAGGYICAPAKDGGADFTLEAFARPTSLHRLLGNIFGLLGRRQNRADVARLKSILESWQPPATRVLGRCPAPGDRQHVCLRIATPGTGRLRSSVGVGRSQSPAVGTRSSGCLPRSTLRDRRGGLI